MDGIHPKFVLSKRFPVHAAVEQLNLEELEKLLTPASDARFHFGRKLNGTDISILHQVIYGTWSTHLHTPGPSWYLEYSSLYSRYFMVPGVLIFILQVVHRIWSTHLYYPGSL